MTVQEMKLITLGAVVGSLTGTVGTWVLFILGVWQV